MPIQIIARSSLRPSVRFSLRSSLVSACGAALALSLLCLPSAQAAENSPVKNNTVKKTVAKPAAKFDYEGEYVNFREWKDVGQFLDEMAAKHGFERAELDQLFAKVRFVQTAIDLMKPAPPGKPKNWQAYSQRFIEPVRINAGIKFWNENAAALARAEQEFGVPAEIIVGIIGVETVYGRNTGRFRVLDALTTLAFSYPDSPNKAMRMAFFRSELENALLFSRKNEIDPLSLLGSYAGAIGLPQFMPSSIIDFAVDYDGDGHIDLRNSSADAIGSVASYLVKHGWQRNDAPPAVYPVSVSPNRAWESFLGQGLEAKFTAQALQAAGVTSATPLPPGVLYGLVDLQNGSEATEYWLASNNFYAITQYNRSYFYAMSVIDLGHAIRQGRGM